MYKHQILHKNKIMCREIDEQKLHAIFHFHDKKSMTSFKICVQFHMLAHELVTDCVTGKTTRGNPNHKVTAGLWINLTNNQHHPLSMTGHQSLHSLSSLAKIKLIDYKPVV